MRKLITFLLLAFSITTNAQEIKVNWGPEYKKEGAFYNFLRYGGHTDKAYYVVQQSLSESKLFIYDFKHNPIGKQDIKYKYGKNLLYLNDIVTTKSGNYFLMSSYDESQEKALFAYTMASKSNMLNTNYTKIYEYPFSYKKVVSFDVAVKNATRLLLPDSFSKKYQHLIIVPAFTIGAFPFQLLKPYNDNSYLIDNCSFSVASSLLDVVALRKRLIVFFYKPTNTLN